MVTVGLRRYRVTPFKPGVQMSLRTLLVLLIPVLIGSQCKPVPFLPALAMSSPAAGQTVSRSAWMVLDFAEDVKLTALARANVFCEDVRISVRRELLDADTVVLQPTTLMPESSGCELRVQTGVLEVVPFDTAAAGAAFVAAYDRRDPNQPLPFPDDFFLDSDPSTVTGFRPNVVLPTHGGTAINLLGGMALIANLSSDGWSPIGNVSVNLTGPPDLSSLPLSADDSVDFLSTIVLIDLTPGSPTLGERIPFELSPRSDSFPPQPLSHNLVIFPSVPLEPTGVYGLVVTDRVESQGGEPLARSSFFSAAVGEPVGGEDAEITRARPLAAEVLDAAESLSPVPIPRSDVVLAVRLTIRSTAHFPNDILAMREDVLATPPNVSITSVTPSFDPDVGAIVEGTFDVPIWLQGAFAVRDDDGLPTPIGTRSLPFTLAVPASAASTAAPIIMYQHGRPGSAENEVPWAASTFAGAGFAVGGFTDEPNRTFPTSEEQTNAIFTVTFLLGQPPDFEIQTYGEQIAFLRALQSMDTLDVLPLGAPDGVPDLDPTKIVYEGISYGSTHGLAFLAYAPDILAAGLVAGSGRFAELLEYQDRTTPTGGDRFLVEQLPTLLTDVRAPDVWMGISLFANVYDRQDSENHARFLLREPLEIDGTTQKASLLVVEGIGDSFNKNNSTHSAAVQLGSIPHLAPALVPKLGLPIVSGPIQGNVDAQTTAALVQFAPLGASVPPSPGCLFESEGHFCAQEAPEAIAQREAFYLSALSGVPSIE